MSPRDSAYLISIDFGRISKMDMQRPMRCRFCSTRFKYETVLIDHENRIHKKEINEMKKRANEKAAAIQHIIFFLESEENDFQKGTPSLSRI